MIFTITSAAIMAFASHASAHMVMSKPQPYNFAALNNSPLNPASGIGFPCHVGGGYSIDDPAAKPTEAVAGGNVEVQFTGSAVHGGGVCQFSVTYENPPPADPSKWKVIHTIVGGCPADAEANLPETNEQDAAGHPTGKVCEGGSGKECLPTFNIPVSKDLKNGEAIFAWTWFNRLGNREMYMNCAPITITGGKDDDSGLANFPPMFVANIGGDSCTTEYGLLALPAKFVGQSVMANQEPAANSLGTCSAAGGGDDAASPVPGPTTPLTPVTPPTPPTNDGIVAAPSASPANPPTANPPQVESPQTPAQPPAAPAPAPSVSEGSVPCDVPGAVVCIGTAQFGICNNGSAVPQALAAGTVCVSGAIQAAPSRKRHVHRHLRPHARSFM